MAPNPLPIEVCILIFEQIHLPIPILRGKHANRLQRTVHGDDDHIKTSHALASSLPAFERQEWALMRRYYNINTFTRQAAVAANLFSKWLASFLEPLSTVEFAEILHTGRWSLSAETRLVHRFDSSDEQEKTALKKRDECVRSGRMVVTPFLLPSRVPNEPRYVVEWLHSVGPQALYDLDVVYETERHLDMGPVVMGEDTVRVMRSSRHIDVIVGEAEEENICLREGFLPQDVKRTIEGVWERVGVADGIVKFFES